MDGWLRDNWGDERAEARAGQAVAFVLRRARRERNIRLSTLAVAACLAGALGLWVAQRAPAPSTAAMASRLGSAPAPAPPPSYSKANPEGNAEARPATPPKPSPVDVTLQKAPAGVELAWSGDPRGQYVVYRCTSPRFDACGVARVVKGTSWVDREGGRASVVYYKVEPRSAS